jgi:hypothetical protein
MISSPSEEFVLLKALHWLRQRARDFLQGINYRFGRKPKVERSSKDNPTIYPLW